MTDQLFVGSYAADTQPGIYAFEFDGATGALTPRGSFTGIANPSFLAAHPSRPWLYSACETSETDDGRAGSVWAFRFDPASLALEPINQQASGGNAPCHLRLDATNKWLLATNYTSGSVSLYPVEDDGSLGAMSDHVQHEGRGADPDRQEGPHAHSSILSPDNRFVIAADLGLDQLVIYELDTQAGKLRPHGHGIARPGAGPRHMAFHPEGNTLYVANELDNTAAVYDYDAEAGTLREVQVLDTVPPDAPHSQVADIHLAPESRRLYVSNRGHESIAVYEFGGSGKLIRLAVQPCGGSWPRNFALAPGGRFILAANQYSGGVDVLPLLPGASEIGPAAAHVDVAQAACVQFVPAEAVAG